MNDKPAVVTYWVDQKGLNNVVNVHYQNQDMSLVAFLKLTREVEDEK